MIAVDRAPSCRDVGYLDQDGYVHVPCRAGAGSRRDLCCFCPGRTTRARLRSEPVMEGWSAIRQRCVVFEDDAVVVLNKPAGVAVMGERHETDLVTMAQEEGERLFPVHRIDKVTSGAILFAKEIRVHAGLTRQFNRRSVEKAYLAITRSPPLPERGTIDLPLSVGRKGRVRVAAPRDAIVADPVRGVWSVPSEVVFDHVRTYPSRTDFATVWQDGQHNVLTVQPVTGRRHQIRVHLAWIGHPIENDPLFQKPPVQKPPEERAPRTHLHSWQLAFDAAWLGDRRITVVAAPDEDFWSPVRSRLPGGTPEQTLARASELLDGFSEGSASDGGPAAGPTGDLGYR